MLQVGRVFNTSGYRYGFNGKEKDNEVKGEGGQQDYGARVYDPRLGRFHSLDPLQKKYPTESNYVFVSNDPVLYLDADGKDKIVTHVYVDKNTGNYYSLRVVVSNDIRSVPIQVASANHWWHEAHDWHWEYEWHDIEQTVTHVISNGVEVAKSVSAETLGQIRETTLIENKFFTKLLIKRYEGGIQFTSKNGGNEEIKHAILPVDIINIDPLLDAFDVTFKASSLEKGYPALFKKLLATEKNLDKMEIINDIIKLSINLKKVLTKVAEKVPMGDSPVITNQDGGYTPNSTVCLSCGKKPHGLTDVIIDEKGNVKDTIKTNVTWRFNPKTKQSERSEKKDTVPNKANIN